MTMTNEPTFASDLREMMRNWNTIETRVDESMPTATDEDRYQATAAAMNNSLGL